MRAVLKGLALCVGSWGYLTTAHAFVDPLDQPAMLSERASISPLYGLAVEGSKFVVAVGPRGHILHSEDGGQHFIQSPLALSSDLVAVYFPSPAQGWAVGHDGVIVHSADGGKRWERQLDGRQIGKLAVEYYSMLPKDDEKSERLKEYAQSLQTDGLNKPFLDVYFENEQRGWAIGAYNLIVHTSDGGKHWIPWMDRTDNPDEYSLHAIRKIGRHIYIVGELGLLLRLDDEQQRFVKLDSPYAGSFFGLTGRDGLLVVFGLRGNAYTSRDEGRSWAKLETGTSYSLNAGSMLTDGSFALASMGGELLLSNVDGDSITKKIPTNRTPVYDVKMTSAGTVIVGPNGVHILAKQ